MSVDENLAAGALVGTVSASDPDAGDSWTYAITDASGNFTIDPNSGEIRTTGVPSTTRPRTATPSPLRRPTPVG